MGEGRSPSHILKGHQGTLIARSGQNGDVGKKGRVPSDGQIEVRKRNSKDGDIYGEEKLSARLVLYSVYYSKFKTTAASNDAKAIAVPSISGTFIRTPLKCGKNKKMVMQEKTREQSG